MKDFLVLWVAFSLACIAVRLGADLIGEVVGLMVNSYRKARDRK